MIENKAIEYLNKEYMLNIDMVECIKRKTAKLIKVTDKGVLLFNSDVYMISTDDETTADEMLGLIDRAELIEAHQQFYVPKVEKKFNLTNKMIVNQAAYLSKELIELKDKELNIKQLDESYTDWILSTYSHKENEEYVRSRVKAGVIYGAFIKDIPVGFIGSHAEGSMGMLEILKEYRRRGIAFDLEAFMVNLFLEHGHTPYSQIVVGNEASVELHKKMNFTFSDKRVYWLM